MISTNLGNLLNRIVQNSRNLLFVQGELAQLTFSALGSASNSIERDHSDELEFTYPVGYTAEKTVIPLSKKYSKQQLLERYQYLAYTQLGLNGLLQLVTIMEAMMGDVLRSVVVKYPQKLGGKRSIPIQSVLEAASLEEMHLRATDALINELSYKSPAEFAVAVDSLIGVNFLACTAFHRYVEIKAARDIYIHNSGVANDVYARKAGSHARVKAGHFLPMSNDYFLESYEHCLQFTEWLEQELHERWHSSEREERDQPQLSFPPPLGDEGTT